MNTHTVADRQAHLGALIASGDFEGAAGAAADSRRALPADPLGWLLGSVVELLANRPETGLSLVEERLAVDPEDIRCLLQKAECLLALGRREDALQAAQTAVCAAGGNFAALDAIAEFLVHAADHGGALKVYDRALAIVPHDANLLAKRATVLRFLGLFARAAADHRRILDFVGDDAEALKGLADLAGDGSTDAQIQAMESALAGKPAGSGDAAALHFGLAKSYEDRGNFSASWGHLRAANAIERSHLNYDSEVDRAVVERLMTCFSQPEPLPRDATGESPIFVVGLPRTGTTLVERIVTSHSSVHGAGELPALSEAVSFAAKAGTSAQRNWLEFAGALAGLDGATIGQAYLARARGRRGAKPRFLDKQPTNYYYLPLIFRAFPNARVLHLTRHPLAACYAIYKTRFQGAFPFAYDLSDLGRFYLGYRRLMAHWHAILPGRIMDVAYEDVVRDHENVTRRILDYLDLPFEAACLDFHLNPASTTTASAIQVRKPLYSSSLEQWRHYAGELEPLSKILRDGGVTID
jgi:tetratricopeptide (TPR) repeat protein